MPDESVRRRSTADCRAGGRRRAAGGRRVRVQRGRVGAAGQVRTAVDVLLRLLGRSAWRLAAAQQPLSTCVSALTCSPATPSRHHCGASTATSTIHTE